MAKEKCCPICYSSKWDHDVVSAFTGWSYCGDCWTDKGREMEIEIVAIVERCRAETILERAKQKRITKGEYTYIR